MMELVQEKMVNHLQWLTELINIMMPLYAKVNVKMKLIVLHGNMIQVANQKMQ